MENYYLVFFIDFNTPKGQELAHLMDVTERKKYLKGFATKRRMNEFVDEYSTGMMNYVRLKPVS